MVYIPYQWTVGSLSGFGSLHVNGATLPLTKEVYLDFRFTVIKDIKEYVGRETVDVGIIAFAPFEIVGDIPDGFIPRYIQVGEQ